MHRKPSAVRWYGSRGLFRSLRRIIRLAAEGDAIDARDWMQPNVLVYAKGGFRSSLDPAVRDAAPGDPEDGAMWFDYLADTGDDWHATYDIAYLAHGDLWVGSGRGMALGASVSAEGQGPPDLPRGAFLVFGGDTAYHVASEHTIRQQVVDPFDAAYGKRFGSGHPAPVPRPVLGVPGNHDWYDSLDGFGRLFRVPVEGSVVPPRSRQSDLGGPIALQGYQPMQQASYFAMYLPWQWDLWAVDIQKGHLDFRQVAFFRAVDPRRHTGKQGTGRKLLLLSATPVVVSGLHDEDLEKELDRVVGSADDAPPTFQLRLDLAGDTHNYQRFDLGSEKVAGDGRRIGVVAGGGGAFLHPTHKMVGPLRMQCTYPPPEESLRLSRSLLKPWRIYAAGMLPWLLVLVQMTLGVRLVAPELGYPLTLLSLLAGVYGLWVGWGFPERTRRWAMVIGGVLSALVAFGLTSLIFSDHHFKLIMLLLFVCLTVFGLFGGGLSDIDRVHKALSAVWILGFAALEALLPFSALLMMGLSPWVGTTTIALGWALIMLVLSPILFGAYLFGSLNWLGAHLNEAFSALRCPRYKHFIRFKLEPGRLTGYVIGFDRPSTDGHPIPNARLIDTFML